MTVKVRDIVTAGLAGVLVITFCTIVLFNAINGRPYSIPGEFLAIVVSVVSYFFGQHAATNGAYSAGVTAGQVAADAANLAASANNTPALPKVL